jgi:uncharacterized OsmC-like protein
MSLVDHETLKTNYESLAEKLANDPDAGLMRPYVSTRLIENVSVKSTFVQYDKEYTFYGDEAKSRAGFERGPSPMRYFLNGVAFCLQGWCAKGSAFAGVDVDGMELDITSFLDMRGEHGFEDVPTYPQWLILDFRVDSPSSEEQVLEMIDWGILHCPLSAFAKKAVPVYERVTHNGKMIRDTVPPEVS